MARFIDVGPDPMDMLWQYAASPRPLPPKIEAIGTLLEVSVGLRDKEALVGIEAALREPSSVDLHILFLIAWFRAILFAAPDWPRMKYIRDRLVALKSRSTPPEIVGWILLSVGITQLHEGDVNAGIKSLTDAVEAVPPASRHHRRLGIVRAQHLLHLGMGAVIDLPPGLDQDHLPASAPPPHGVEDPARAWPAMLADRLRASRLVNSAITGELDTAAEGGPVVTHPGIVGMIGESYYRVACQTLALMAEQQDHRPLKQLLEGVLSQDDAAPWIRSTRALLERQPEEALKLARLHTARADRRTIAGFDEYTLVRAELAAGHGEAARRLLQLARGPAGHHYLDDIFFARAERLAGNHDLAAQRFAQAMHTAEIYRAKGRLNFEIELARELDPIDLATLAQHATKFTPDHRPLELEGDSERKAEPLPATRRLVYASASMSAVHDRILAFGRHSAPVLVTGETGTGKELVAEALHETAHPDSPFVAINCGALSDTLIESELFGYTQGAFTGAHHAHEGLFREAGDGTVFLDEIGDISVKLQLALLRVLETSEVRPLGSSQRHKVRCRIVAATNADLEQRVSEGRFRQDLLFRLQRLHIHVPPLRDRPEDTLAIAKHFLDLDRAKGTQAGISEQGRRRLQAHPWPGNVRELRNVIERMRVLNSDKLHYELDDLESVLDLRRPEREAAEPHVEQASPPEKVAKASTPQPLAQRPGASSGRDDAIDTLLHYEGSPMRRLERLRKLFDQTGHLKTGEVARILGVSRHTATRYLKQLASEGLIEKIQPGPSPRSHYYARKA